MFSHVHFKIPAPALIARRALDVVRRGHLRAALCALLCFFAIALHTTQAGAQPLSCVTPNALGSGAGQLGNAGVAIGTTGCLDFTITTIQNPQPAQGYLQFQLEYEKTGANTLTIKGITTSAEGLQAAYTNTTPTSIDPVPLPIGGTMAERAWIGSNFDVTSSPGAATINATTGQISGLSFTFTSSTGATVVVDNFRSSNIFLFGTRQLADISVNGNDVACPYQFIVLRNNDCRYGQTDLFGNAIAAPEIDGSRIPQLALLLAAGYLMFRRRWNPSMA